MSKVSIFNAKSMSQLKLTLIGIACCLGIMRSTELLYRNGSIGTD